MYRTCITCGATLGANEVLEHFPVGRRLAFDPHRGRLWAVCLNCRSWNLAPIEERWEAVEEAERAFETAQVGASTEHVTLGRVPEGLDLVRIGPARSVEFAGWRFGDALVGRWERKRKASRTALGVGLLAGTVGMSAPILLASAAWGMGTELLHYRRSRRIIERVASPGGEAPVFPVRGRDIHRARLHVPEEGGWELHIPRYGGNVILTGPDAIRISRRMLPFMNREGAKEELVRQAVRLTEAHAGPDGLFGYAARSVGDGEEADQLHGRVRFRRYRIASADPVVKTALEIAANDETERRALEGELALLEREWREADELAGIIDDLLLPEGVRSTLRRLRSGFSGASAAATATPSIADETGPPRPEEDPDPH